MPPKGPVHRVALQLTDLGTDDLDEAMRIVAGTARSMGVQVEG